MAPWATFGFARRSPSAAVDNLTTAAIETGASIRGATVNDPGAANITVRANAEHAVHTEAKGGAGAADEDGGLAITPVFSVAVVDHLATAHVSEVNLTGNLTVEAKQIGTSETKADGAAAAAGTAAGIVVAWDSGKNTVTTTTNGKLIAGGAVTLSSDSMSFRPPTRRRALGKRSRACRR